MLKRKRSVLELAVPPEPAQTTPVVTTSHQAPDAHLSGRTLKRFRDGRPSEGQVHQHTLHLLYSAQRRPRQDDVSMDLPPCDSADAPPADTQQTLHHFWSAVSESPTSSPSPDGAMPGSSPIAHGPVPNYQVGTVGERVCAATTAPISTTYLTR